MGWEEIVWQSNPTIFHLKKKFTGFKVDLGPTIKSLLDKALATLSH